MCVGDCCWFERLGRLGRAARLSSGADDWLLLLSWGRSVETVLRVGDRCWFGDASGFEPRDSAAGMIPVAVVADDCGRRLAVGGHGVGVGAGDEPERLCRRRSAVTVLLCEAAKTDGRCPWGLAGDRTGRQRPGTTQTGMRMRRSWRLGRGPEPEPERCRSRSRSGTGTGGHGGPFRMLGAVIGCVWGPRP